ncbi:hypothetical protein Maeo_0429 [Methanococcus aeolicus Nankai-3]|uniref:Uncharacterized protein n=1 Tax=Methanococcus aeolicus (strain ATCC BAA-1280 / DSM 17508 / OCM 812 / Nankai-3) TaxID=419665 RepID=A6UU43_META3|nr:hypothetical protein [Methanococcus aeolicus]ABR56015.1 hypothetical protein Maeo_0429 [Methanococcus aeolicus Nankai-3]
MNDKDTFTNYIINNFPNIIPILSNNFPFKFPKVKYVPSKAKSNITIYNSIIKVYLNLNDFINKLRSKSEYLHVTKTDVIIIGYTGKIVNNPKGIPIGDYSNYFIKDFLNRNDIKTKELLIFNLKDISRIINILNMQKYLKHNNSDLLFLLKYQTPKKIDLDNLKNICTKCIENKLYEYIYSDLEYSVIPKEDLKKRISNLEKYIKFITSNTFVSYVLSLAHSIKYYLEMSSPKILIINSISGLVDRLCVYVAKYLGIKIIFLPHGIGENLSSSNFINYFKINPIPIDVYINPTYDKKNITIKFKNIEICNYGVAIYGHTIDNYFNEISLPKDNRKLTVLYATQPWVRDGIIEKRKYIEFLYKFFNILKQIDCDIIIKFHPRDNDNIYKNILKKLNIKNVEYSYKAPPFFIEDIKKSDVLLTHISGICYESILAGTPVISIIPHELEKYYYPYESIEVPKFTENNLNKLKNFLKQKYVDKSLNNLLEIEQKKVKPKILGDDSLNLFLFKIKSLLEK